MIGENSTSEKYCAELKIADAVPRSVVGNQAATIRALPGNDGDSASPSRKRSANSTTTALAALHQPTRPCSTVNPDQAIRLTTWIRFEPNRSSSQPPGSWPMTYAQPKAENT